MMKFRTVLLGDDNRVQDHLLTEDAPTEAELRLWLTGGAAVPTLRLSDDGAELAEVPPPPLDQLGRFIVVPNDSELRPIGCGWTYDGAEFHPPPPVQVPRVITAQQFRALFTDAEAVRLYTADPALTAAAIDATIQGTVNLDSARLPALMDLAVAKGVLTRARADQVLAGKPAGAAPA